MDLTTPIDVSAVNKERERNVKNIRTLAKHSVSELLMHMTPMLGVKNSKPIETAYEEKGSRRYDGQFRGKGKKHVTIGERDMVVKPVVYEAEDEPERYRDQYRIAVAGGLDATKNPFEKWLIDYCIGNASQDLYLAAWGAAYESGTDDQPIEKAFDGIGTILSKGITDGDIALGKNNYGTHTGAYTASNIMDRLLQQWRNAPSLFRKNGGKMFISYDMGDLYDDNYKALHDSPPDKDQSGQMYLEGSQGKCELVRLDIVPDNEALLVDKRNFLYGTDKLTDLKKLIAFISGNPYMFTAAMKYVWGFQFGTFDPRVFSYAKTTA